MQVLSHDHIEVCQQVRHPAASTAPSACLSVGACTSALSRSKFVGFTSLYTIPFESGGESMTVSRRAGDPHGTGVARGTLE